MLNIKSSGLKRSTKCKGMTLIEILMIFVILTVMGMIVVPWYSGLVKKWNLETEARKVMERLRETQQLSKSTQVQHGIYFDTIGESYNIGYYQSSMFNTTETVFIRNGVNIVTTSIMSPAYTLLFDQFGAPVSGGDIIMRSSDGNDEVRVRVRTATGRIVLQWS